MASATGARENGAYGGRPPLAPALGGGDTVPIEPAGDFGQAHSAGRFAEDPGDDVRGQSGLPARTFWSSTRCSRLLGALGEVALELGGGDESSPPFGLDGCDRGYDSSVERREADAECLGGLLARVDKAVDGLLELSAVQPLKADGLWSVPLLLLALASLLARGQFTASGYPYSNGEAGCTEKCICVTPAIALSCCTRMVIARVSALDAAAEFAAKLVL